MHKDHHLHIDEEDQLTELIVRAARSVSAGSLAISFGGDPVATIGANTNTIVVDVLKPAAFRIIDETSIHEKLKTASEFGNKLSDNGITLSFLRKGKEAVRLGKDARPSFSKLLTRSNDIQLTSVREFGKLKNDLKNH